MPLDRASLRRTARLRVELHSRGFAAVDVKNLDLDLEIRFNHLRIHTQLLAIAVSFVELSFHPILEVEELAQHHTHTDDWIQCVRRNVFSDNPVADVIVIGFIRHNGLTAIHQLRMHLMRECVEAHRARVFLNELVHLNRVFVCVETAEKAAVIGGGRGVMVIDYIIHLWRVGNRVNI